MDNVVWGKLANNIRSRTVSSYDPAAIFVDDDSLRAELNIPHLGLFVGLIDISDKELIREGFLRGGLTNIHETAAIVARNLTDNLKAKNINQSTVEKSSFYLTLVNSCTYLPDPLKWHEDSDGLYFQWGQRYHGLYLPYQIQRMDSTKVDILNKLAMWEAGVASSLWREAEGLIYRLGCSSYSA